MKRPLLALVALAACGGDKSARTTTTTAGSAATDGVERFISDDVTALMRTSADQFPLLLFMKSLVSPAPDCWTTLVGPSTAAYQLEVAAEDTSYAVFVGDISRASVESCVKEVQARQPRLLTGSEGERLIIGVEGAGDAHLVWRGNTVIAGSRDQVTRTLAGNSAETAARWRDRIALLPAAGAAVWRDDALMKNLFGVATTFYMLTLDGTSSEGLGFSARLFAHYGTDADAAIVARKVKAAEIEPGFAPPQELIAAIQKFEVKQTGSVVEIAMDNTMFEQAGVDMLVMHQWVGRLHAAAD